MKRKKSRRICAWCGKVLGEADTPEDTHGICLECARKLLEEENIRLLGPDLASSRRIHCQ